MINLIFIMITIMIMPRKKREFTLSDDSHEYIGTLPSRTASIVVDEALKLHKQNSMNETKKDEKLETKVKEVNEVTVRN